MTDAARAKAIANGCTHAQGTRGRRRVCLECLAAGLGAHAAEQAAALRENYDEYLKESASALRQVQQANVDLERETAALREENARLRASIKELLSAEPTEIQFVRERARALLADPEGQP